MPREEMLEIKKDRTSLTIGIPLEDHVVEKRISLLPDGVSLLIQNGHQVLVESGAGTGARYSDHDYAEAGAAIVGRGEAFQADLVLKVAPPSQDELEMTRERQIIISTLASLGRNKEYFRKLMDKKVTAFAFEFIKDRFGTYPVLRSVSEIAGNTSMQIAAQYLGDPEYGQGSMLGGSSGIVPTEVVILGAGTVGENAARVATAMGATVKVFDTSIHRLRRLQQQLGQRLFTSIIQPRTLLSALKTADVLIAALHSEYGQSPVVVTEDMVRMMKGNSVIIDVSIDQGGCVETSRQTTHKDPVYKKYDVIHYCVPNIASRVPKTSSWALNNFFVPVLLKLGESSNVENLIREDRGLCHGIYLFKGIVTKKSLSDTFGLPFQDIDLLLAAFH